VQTEQQSRPGEWREERGLRIGEERSTIAREAIHPRHLAARQQPAHFAVPHRELHDRIGEERVRDPDAQRRIALPGQRVTRCVDGQQHAARQERRAGVEQCDSGEDQCETKAQ